MAALATAVADLQTARAAALTAAPSAVPKLDAAIAEVLAVGSLPTWVPAVGTIANVGLNKLIDVDPCPAGNCAWSGITKQGNIWNDTGVAWAPQLGTMGSFVWGGGGHNDYYGTEVYRYDVETRLVSRLTNPDPLTFGRATSPPLPLGDISIGYHCDALNGEVWADATYTTTKQNVPASGHLYGYQVVVPVGDAGSLVTVARPALTPVGSRHARRAHIIDLAKQVAAGPSASLWERASADLNPSKVPAYGGACYDPVRNCIWGTESTQTLGGVYRLNLASRKWDYFSMLPQFSCYYGTVMYAPEFDKVVYFRRYATGTVMMWFDPATPKTRVANVTGDIPPHDATNSPLGGGADWCSDLPGGPGFVYYAGGGGFDCYAAQPSADLLTWTFTKYTLTGDAPAIQLSPPNCTHLHRFVYAPTARCFLWFASRGAAVNAWRLFN